MMQKHRISTNIGKEQRVTVELKQDYDQLEILSLKFSQTDVYTSLCADYGVVCGRITANDGFGIPNVRVSIFVPQTETDSTDPVISALYPYTEVSDKNADNYRYNLLPARKQHGGHKPTGTFPDQSDILTREEVLEVYENYYRYTVKTNESGDFMIWGVPVGKQNLHVDLDLSDIGCFSLRPYDFIKRGEGIEKFERYFEFKSSTDIDGLPQIIKYDRTIEVFPFWGNLDLCEIGITRVDYDISQSGIRIEPISLILTSTITDDNGDAVKRNGVIRRNTGYKCNLQTTEGKISAVRYTGKKVYGSNGTTLYPQLEYFNPSETIDEDGVAMVVLPMNLEYVFTNEFGEQEITNDTNKGIPTTTIARFKFTLDGNNEKTGTANYLVPQIREYNSNANGKNDLEDLENNDNLYSVNELGDGTQLQLQPRRKEQDSLTQDSLTLNSSTNILSVEEIVMRCTTKVTLHGDFNCEVEIENSDLKKFNGWLRENKNLVNITLEIQNEYQFNIGTFHGTDSAYFHTWLHQNWTGFNIEKSSKMKFKNVQEEDSIERLKEDKKVENEKKNKIGRAHV
jgi:hypothetical protein